MMPDAMPTACRTHMRRAMRKRNAERYARTDVRTYGLRKYLLSVDQLALRTAYAHTAILAGFGCRAVLASLAGGAA